MSMGLAIIRSAGLLVPAPQRPDWLAEWRAELCYIQQTCNARALPFCLGAYKDALWFRRQYRIRWLESPVQCLSFLAVIAIVSLVAALPGLWWDPFRDSRGLVAGKTDHPPGDAAFYRGIYEPVRTRRGLVLYSTVHASSNLFEVLHVTAPHPGSKPAAVLSRSIWWDDFGGDRHIAGRMLEIDGKKTPIAGVIADDAWPLPGNYDVWLLDDQLPNDAASFVVARSTTQTGLHPLPRRLRSPVPFFLMAMLASLLMAPIKTLASGIRHWPFLLAKIGLILPTIYACACLADVSETRPAMLLFSLVACPGGMLALRWAVADQRSRCPVCLRLLSNPVRFGNASRTFLAWYGTELTCGQGHGVLRVPEVADTGALQWVDLEELCAK